ncbi:uncharacterized protein LOC110238780 [Exaiptasia diaphana]|uniref:HTH arsR-type domain-containing protein n=1 Tax=Exaiptasia diaphana TaxID=2652724 RepID=A0A913X7N3_EXADI|nr:uncharacterized protein LOC110238780 [Exaiptasia diaphana]
MQQELINDDGLCRASIRTEEEIAAIRAELAEEAPKLHATLRWLEAAKDPTRFKIVHLLRRHERLCVCDLANVLGITSSAVSQHLRKLKDMDLVSTARVKQTIFYALRDPDFIAFLGRLSGDEGDLDRVVVAGAA